MRSLWQTTGLLAAKDLRIEWRSRVGMTQIAGFALLVLFLFAFALGLEPGVLEAATPGLLWVTVLLSLLLAVGRSVLFETSDGGLDGLRLAGLEPGGIFLGKAVALLVQLVVLVVVLVVGVVVFYEATIPGTGVVLLVTSALLACIGLAATGTLYGALSAGARARETLLPLLLLPAVAPVLIGSTRAFEAAMGTSDVTTSEGWPWVGLLAVFAALYVAVGLVAYGPLLEDS